MNPRHQRNTIETFFHLTVRVYGGTASMTGTFAIFNDEQTQ